MRLIVAKRPVLATILQSRLQAADFVDRMANSNPPNVGAESLLAIVGADVGPTDSAIIEHIDDKHQAHRLLPDIMSQVVQEEKSIDLHTKRIEDVDFEHFDSAPDFLDAARIATEREHELTFRRAVRLYPAAFFWAIAISFTIIMEGYNTYLLGNFYAYPAFARKYGTYQPATDTYLVEPKWQVTMSDVGVIGNVVGLIGMGPACDWLGHRYVIMIGLVFLVGTTFMAFFSPNVQVLTASLALGGVPTGLFGILGSAYASEVAPLALRGFLTSFVSLPSLSQDVVHRAFLGEHLLGHW